MSVFKIIKNANVYTPDFLGLKNILIAENKIVYIGDKLPDLSTALEVEVFDAQEKRLLPGFIDAHVHVTGGGGESGASSKIPPVPLSQFTRYGVTTVVGVLGTDDITRTTSSLLIQTKGLNEEGLTAYCHCGGYHVPPTTLTGSVRSDIVHINEIIGVGEIAISDHRSSQPTLDEFLRIASEAHVAGLMTNKAGILHIHMGDGKRGLELVREALNASEIPARVFNPTHCNRNPHLFVEACDLVKLGCTIDLTAFPECEEDIAIPAHEAFLTYKQKGLPLNQITISSDGGGCLPIVNESGHVIKMDVGTSSTLIFTLKKLLESGEKLEEVLPVFTSNVAKLLKLNQKGFIQCGSDADLILLDDNHNIQNVMALGKWHLKDGRVQISGTFEG